jgi:hypothetical protein
MKNINHLFQHTSMYKSITQLCNTSLLDFVGVNYIIRDRRCNVLKLISNNSEIAWVLPLNGKGGEYTSLSEEEFIYFSNRKSTFYSKLSGEKQCEENKYYYRYGKGNSVFIDMDAPEAFATEKYNASIPYENLVYLIYLDYLIQYQDNDSFLTCRSLETGEEIWKADVGELGRYENFEGRIIDGNIQDLFTHGEFVVAKVISYGLVAYNIATGRQVWGHTGGSSGYYLVALYNNIFFIISDYYYELDAQTGEVLRREDFMPLLKEVGFRNYWLTQPAVNERYIAIASHYDSAILLINRADFTVAQRIDLEGCQNGIPLTNTPRFHDKRLFQLDGDGTLHVFEEI